MKKSAFSFLCCVAPILIAAAPARIHEKSTLTIKINGLNKILTKNIRALLRLNAAGKLSLPTVNPLRIELNETAIEETIRDGLAPFGYFEPTISHHLQRLSPRLWQINFDIKPGQRVTYRRLRLQFTDHLLPTSAQQELRQKWPIKVGQPFTQASFKQAKQLLNQLADSYGYLSHRLTVSQVSVDVRHLSAVARFKMTLGKRYAFSETRFNAPGYKTDFLKRFLLYKPGQPYRAQLLEQTRLGLINSRVFGSVNTTLSPNKRTHKIAVKTTLTSLPDRLYTVGTGYGTDTGPRVLFMSTFNNLKQDGQQLKLLLRASKINNNLSFQYRIPGHYPPNDAYTIHGGITHMDENAGKSFSKSMAVGYITKKGYWSAALQLIALNEKYNLSNRPKTKTLLAYPDLQLSYLRQDNPTFPTQGIHAKLGISTSATGVVSDISFRQYRFQLKWIMTFINRIRFIMQTHLGYTDIKHLNNLPLSLQLMAGGVDSLRGYSYHSLYGGRELFTASGEVQLRFYKQWYLGAFCDVGNVSNDIFHQPLKVGVGPSLTWKSPLGAFSFSIAQSVSEPRKSTLFQFSLGTSL